MVVNGSIQSTQSLELNEHSKHHITSVSRAYFPCRDMAPSSVEYVGIQM